MTTTSTPAALIDATLTLAAQVALLPIPHNERNETHMSSYSGPATSVVEPVAYVKHDDVLRVAGKRTYDRQRVVTLSGAAARYSDFDGPDGDTKYAKRLQSNRASYIGASTTHDRHNGAVWLSAESSVIAAREYHDAMRAEQARDIVVQPGDVIHVDSDRATERGLYRVELPRPNRCDGDSCLLIALDTDSEV